jgi:beta-lactamase class A
VLICAYTQGGSPTSKQFEAVYAEIGRMVERQLG